MINLLLKLVLSICLIALLVVCYRAPLPLVVYNAKYPFMNQKILETLFLIYPYYNFLIIVLLWLAAKMAKPLIFLTFALYLSYHLKLLIATECAVCAANGLIPFLDMNVQILIFSVLTVLSGIYFFLRDKEKPKEVN
jgi:hypothetical protein